MSATAWHSKAQTHMRCVSIQLSGQLLNKGSASTRVTPTWVLFWVLIEVKENGLCVAELLHLGFNEMAGLHLPASVWCMLAHSQIVVAY